MTKKILSFLVLAVLVGVGFGFVSKASADTFPAGCYSNLGYSTTTGTPCSGTTTANLYPQSSTTVSTGYPQGCTSSFGYSASSGMPCNGSSIASQFITGCTSPLGYSTTSGVPCSGTSSVMTYLAGCTAVTGYSTVSGAPCNGTSVATPVINVPLPVTDPGTTTPGLPTTGAGGNMPFNTLALAISGIVALGGAIYLSRRSHAA